MKKFFAFLSKLIALATFLGVILYCVGYFFASKARRVNELFTNKETADEDEDNIGI